MRLRTAVLILVGGTVVFFVAAVTATDRWEWAKIVPAVLGVTIVLPTAVASMAGVVKVSAVRPDAGPLAAMSATFMRMVWAVGVVALLRGWAKDFGTTSEAIAEWTTGFYVFTLFVETILLWRMLAPAGGTTNDTA